MDHPRPGFPDAEYARGGGGRGVERPPARGGYDRRPRDAHMDEPLDDMHPRHQHHHQSFNGGRGGSAPGGGFHPRDRGYSNRGG